MSGRRWHRRDRITSYSPSDDLDGARIEPGYDQVGLVSPVTILADRCRFVKAGPVWDPARMHPRVLIMIVADHFSGHGPDVPGCNPYASRRPQPKGATKLTRGAAQRPEQPSLWPD